MGRSGRNKKAHQNQIIEKYHVLSAEAKKGIIIILLIIVSLISILSFFSLAGVIGQQINSGLEIMFGLLKYLFPLALLYIIYSLIKPDKQSLTWVNYLGIIILFLGLNGTIHLIITRKYFLYSLPLALEGIGGGLSGVALSYPLRLYLDFWASLIILIGITIISLIIIFNNPLFNILKKINFNQSEHNILNPFKRRSLSNNKIDEDSNDEEDELDEETKKILAEADKKQTAPPLSASGQEKSSTFNQAKETSEPEIIPVSKYKKLKIDLPLALLNNKSTKPLSGDIDLATQRIVSTLHNFGIDIEMSDVNVGPTVTQYSFKPADGIKLSRITSLNNDLALSLAAHPIRIEAPIPGKSLVGIEVPNHQPAMVPLRSVIESESFKTTKSSLAIALGKDVSGKCWAINLPSLPHLLVAGATGSGKSVCLNSIILSLLYQNNPDTLRLILVDPKRVEFTVYNGIPHLLAPVITDVTKTINALRWAIHEMDHRFDVLSKANKRNIESYNQDTEDKMPYIVIIIDELADIMAAASAEVEACIIRLTQMARAIGIHLIVATQRPSVDIITGLIKANIPGRVAFSVASQMDSRTILDTVGADKLIGKGDMLYLTAELSKPRRLQGCYVSDEEIKRVTNFLRQAGGDPEYDDSITEKQSGKSSFDFSDSDDDDSLLDEAKNVVIQAGKASASLLQRRLRVGYARAARLIDLLEERGIVGPADGARPRDVLISAADIDDQPTPSVFNKINSLENNDIDESQNSDENNNDFIEDDSADFTNNEKNN